MMSEFSKLFCQKKGIFCQYKYFVRKISSPLRMVPLWTRTRLIPTIACCIFFFWVNFNASPFGWRNFFKVLRGSIFESLVNDCRSIPVTVLKMCSRSGLHGLHNWRPRRLTMEKRLGKSKTHHRGVWHVIANLASPMRKNPDQLSLKVFLNPILDSKSTVWLPIFAYLIPW